MMAQDASGELKMTDIEQAHAQHIDHLTERVAELEEVVQGLAETVMFFINQQNRIMEGDKENVQVN